MIGNKKVPLSGRRILNAICDLRETFGDAIFTTYAWGYDVAQILRCLDVETAGRLQAGEIVKTWTDEDGWLRPWERSPVIKPSCGDAVYQMPH